MQNLVQRRVLCCNAQVAPVPRHRCRFSFISHRPIRWRRIRGPGLDQRWLNGSFGCLALQRMWVSMLCGMRLRSRPIPWRGICAGLRVTRSGCLSERQARIQQGARQREPSRQNRKTGTPKNGNRCHQAPVKPFIELFVETLCTIVCVRGADTHPGTHCTRLTRVGKRSP